MYMKCLEMLKWCSIFATKHIFDSKYWFHIDKISLLVSLEWKNSNCKILLNRKLPSIKSNFMLISYSDISLFSLEVFSPWSTVDKWTPPLQSHFIFRKQIILILKFFLFKKKISNTNDLLFFGTQRAVEVYWYVFTPYLVMLNLPRSVKKGVKW